jgi:chromate reductase
MKILAISGSLRAASINTSLLRTAIGLAPASMNITLCPRIGELPLFNPELDSELPSQVISLRAEVNAADALLIATPEYAHGVSGAMKNALDWLVSLETFANKPVAIFNASPRAYHADSALREILKTMSASIIEEASVRIPLFGKEDSVKDLLESQTVTLTIQTALLELHQATLGSS